MGGPSPPEYRNPLHPAPPRISRWIIVPFLVLKAALLLAAIYFFLRGA
jgi:hypothetical protein